MSDAPNPGSNLGASGKSKRPRRFGDDQTMAIVRRHRADNLADEAFHQPRGVRRWQVPTPRPAASHRSKRPWRSTGSASASQASRARGYFIALGPRKALRLPRGPPQPLWN